MHRIMRGLGRVLRPIPLLAILVIDTNLRTLVKFELKLQCFKIDAPEKTFH